jgi:glyoxylase-like metal-dependent hydrolase (beta-lactamase superfamily II)
MKEIIMSNKNFPFRLGTFKCIVVSDGTHTYLHPIQIFVSVNTPRERLKQVLREHNLDLERWEQYISPYPSLVINTGQHLVLVDTGAGGLEPTTGKLIPNLQAEGIKPEDIDTVILTHGHPDHIGGNTNSEGRPAFPNARYIMWKDEWDFWTSEPKLTELDIPKHIKELLIIVARNNLLPIQHQLELLDHETEIVPGIQTVAAPGHTPGHMAVAITSDNEQLLCLSDAVLHQIHLKQLEWYTAVDFAPKQVVTTRRRLLDWAATEKALVHAFHFPLPGLGYVAQKGKAWQWEPIETTG